MKMKKINETNVDETNNSFIKKIKRNEEIKQVESEDIINKLKSKIKD